MSRTQRKTARKGSEQPRDASADAKATRTYARPDERAKLTPLQQALAFNLAAVLDNPETPANLYNAMVDVMCDYQLTRENNLDFSLQCVRGMAEIVETFGSCDAVLEAAH
jgi:hypothetical protein